MATLSASADRRPTDRAALVCGLGAGLVALVLGAIHIGRSFNYDEAITYGFFINGGSIRRALTTQVVFNNHPMFSAVQAAAWRLGFVGETSQRVGPVLCGAVTVGATVWYTARRVGVVGGLTAAAVLTLNPVFLEQFRLLRGYSLATMAVVVAGLALERSWSDPRARWLVLQGLAMVVAVTTHAYSAVTLLMLAVATLCLGRLRRDHLLTWGAAAVAAFVIQYPVLDEARLNATTRGSVFRDDFPILLTRALLGWTWPATLLTGALVLAGALSLARRSPAHLRAVAAAGAVLVLVVAILWLGVQPRDLYFRFFVGVVPLLAHLAGRGVALLPTGVGFAAFALVVVLLVPGARDIVEAQPTLREAAVVVDRARASGREVCGWQSAALHVYTAPVRPVEGLTDLDGCDVYIAVLALAPEQRAAAREAFSARRSLDGITIWADEDIIDDLVPAP